MKASKFLPIIETLDEYERLEYLWQEVYESRSKKVGKQKAVFSANATIYTECLKIFLAEKGDIYSKWINKISGPPTRELIEAKNNYNSYNIDGYNVIITTDKKVLDDYPNAERKGKMRDMDEFERELIFKISDKYNLKFHPSLYFVINGE